MPTYTIEKYATTTEADAYTVNITNDAKTLPTTTGGTVTYTDSGTTISVIKGTKQLQAVATGTTPTFDQFGVTQGDITDTNITKGSQSVSGTNLVFGNASSITDTQATVTYPINIENVITISKTQSFAKSQQGATGSAGVGGYSVKLTASKYVINYSTAGVESDTITFTADGSGASGTETFLFAVDSGSGFVTKQAASTTATYAMADGDEPAIGQSRVIKVIFYDGGVEKAIDSISIFAVQDGTDAITIILTNDSHTIPTNSSGASGTYTGSGTDIRVWRGGTALAYHASNASTFSIGTPDDTDITVGGASTVSTYTRRYAVASAFTTGTSTKTATISFPITIRDAASATTVINKLQTFSKSFAGTDGVDGAGGADGSDGTDARVVNLTMADQTFEYNTNGASPSPSNAVVTATALNTTGTVYYDFFKNDSSVQNTTTATYTYTPPAAYSSMPEKLEVQIREGSNSGTIKARDQITASGLQAGSDAIVTVLSNEAHTLPVTTGGTVTYTGSGTDITVWLGTTQLNYGTGNSQFVVTVTDDTNITVGSASTVSSNIRRYGVHSSITADTAEITYSIAVKDTAGVTSTFVRKQTFSKSKQGATGAGGVDGADGSDGSDGTDARAVNLTMADQTFEYNTNGASPSPSNAVVTATALNTTGTVYYQFFKNDNSVQNTTGTTYTYTPPSAYSSMPEKLEVQIREGSSSGTIKARDQITASGLQAGSDAIVTVLSNEAHTLPVTTAGTVTYTNSGTDITVWLGTTQLNYGTSNSQFQVTGATGSSITVGSASTVSSNIRRYAVHNSMSADTAKITYTIAVKDTAGVTSTFTRLQTFAKSHQGATGTGDDGDDGKKTGTGQLYYQVEAASAPSAPSNSSVTFTFATGAMSGGVIGTSGTTWNITPPTATGGASTSKTWFVYWNAVEATAGGGTATPTFDSTVRQGTGFNTLVTFANGDFAKDGSTITTIDGSNITTGTISSANLSGTSDGSDFSSAGMRITLSNGAISAKQFRIASDGTAAFKGALSAASGTFGGALSGGTISIGSGEAIFKADSNGIYLGSATFGNAEFRVTPQGALTAESATITGTINATAGTFTNIDVNSGTIGGFTIGTNTLTATNFTVDPSGKSISLGTGNTIFIADADTGIQLGHATFGSAPFRVTTAGALTATSATITGALTATTGTIGGWTATNVANRSTTSDLVTSGGSGNLLYTTYIWLDSTNQQIVLRD